VTASGFRFTRRTRLTPQDDDDASSTFGSDTNHTTLNQQGEGDDSDGAKGTSEEAASDSSISKAKLLQSQQKRQQQQPEVFEFDEVELIVGKGSGVADVPMFPSLEAFREVRSEAEEECGNSGGQDSNELQRLVTYAKQKTNEAFAEKHGFISTTCKCVSFLPHVSHIHTYIHTYVHAYIHTYIHTYIHAYIHR
jgi:hypothetical protein